VSESQTTKRIRPEYAYELNVTGAKIAAAFDVRLDLPDFKPRREVLPAQLSPIVRLSHYGERICVLAQWGLAPYRSTDANIGSRRVTARAETIATAPAFRAAFKQRRCLVPATGFYELGGRPSTKNTHRLALPKGKLIAIAGLWDIWHDQTGKRNDTYAIITCDMAQQSGAGPARMPVIIQPADFDAWLSEPRIDLLRPASLQALKAELEPWLPVMARSTAGSPEPPLETPASAVFDSSTLEHLLERDAALINTTLKDFIVLAGHTATKLIAASAAGDTAQTAALSHQLKSSARTVGALALGDCCEALEAMALAGNSLAIAAEVPTLRRLWAITQDAIGKTLAVRST
jgi:putative SOS response-associated peptidase YedK/HPt (histidine-containing phosphotransfer) domain-containing protein